MRDAGREEEGEVDGGRWAEATEGQGGVKMALDNFDLKSGQIALMESLTKLVWFQSPTTSKQDLRFHAWSGN